MRRKIASVFLLNQRNEFCSSNMVDKQILDTHLGENTDLVDVCFYELKTEETEIDMCKICSVFQFFTETR